MLMWLFPFLFNPTLSCPCNDQTSTQSSKVGHDRFRLIWPDWSLSRATQFPSTTYKSAEPPSNLETFFKVVTTPLLAVTYGHRKFSCHHPCTILARTVSFPPRIGVRGKLHRESTHPPDCWIPAFASMTSQSGRFEHITLKDLNCYRLRIYRACRHQSPDARP